MPMASTTAVLQYGRDFTITVIDHPCDSKISVYRPIQSLTEAHMFVQVKFDDIFGEPDPEVFSMDSVWSMANKVSYNSMRVTEPQLYIRDERRRARPQ